VPETTYIATYIYNYTYIWLKNGMEFWSWPTYVGRNILVGWKWSGTYWSYFEVKLNTIENLA
jgi:hypothetical protein